MLICIFDYAVAMDHQMSNDRGSPGQMRFIALTLVCNWCTSPLISCQPEQGSYCCCSVGYQVAGGKNTYFQTMVVPVRPGVCRTFFKFGFGKGVNIREMGGVIGTVARLLPPWLVHVLSNDQTLADQDVVVMHGQVSQEFNREYIWVYILLQLITESRCLLPCLSSHESTYSMATAKNTLQCKYAGCSNPEALC